MCMIGYRQICGGATKAAMFLASPMAEFITDKVLVVNGGFSAGRAFLPLSTPLSS
jgi:hypothetical protein